MLLLGGFGTISLGAIVKFEIHFGHSPAIDHTIRR